MNKVRANTDRHHAPSLPPASIPAADGGTQRGHYFVEAGDAFRQLAGLDGATPAPAVSDDALDDEASYLQRMGAEPLDVIVIGGGQAGLSMGYHLQQRGLRFVIVDAHERIGDAWRKRWDSLRLFTPASLDSLDGMPFPAPADHYPSKDEMADYLEAYAARFALPVLTGSRVRRLFRRDGRFVVQLAEHELTADQVVVAMAGYQDKRVPLVAQALSADITQLHSSDYHNPLQLRSGSVLIVGGGNSGAEIALELAKTRQVQLVGPLVGEIPVRHSSWFGRVVFMRALLRVVFHHILTIRTPMGRKAQAGGRGVTPLIRTKTRDLLGAGVQRTPLRVSEVRDGRPVLEDGQVLDVQNVIWCTGFHAAQSWIDLPVFDAGKLVHQGGVVAREPGLYFVGLPFLYAMSSSMVHGVGRDAARIAGEVAARVTRH